MYSWENPDDRVAIAEMNSELRHAQLELLSAHCATHQLRLRYSTEDLARFGQRDILRKSVQTVAALNEYYAAIEGKIPAAEAVAANASTVSETRVSECIGRVSSYMLEQRERYLPSAVPLTSRQKALMWPFFSSAFLEKVRAVQLPEGERLPTPSFYAEARSLGFVNLPEVTHMQVVTFADVIVFNEPATERALFHALVHAMQFEVLGLERYCELYVRSFIKTKLHFSVPLEAHAFSLESKFAASPAERFSVEEVVRLWTNQSRY